jgi:esterase/lipase
MLLSVMEQAPETYPYFSAPFLIVQGGHDKLVNPEGAFELYEQSRSLDKQVGMLFILASFL